MRVALLQLNPTVGDLEGNAALIGAAVREAGAVDLCVTSEMALTGYPARDLLLQPGFIARAVEVAADLASSLISAAPVLVGMPVAEPGHARPAAVQFRRAAARRARRTLLPQVAAADLRRLRRGPLFRAGRWAGGDRDRRAALRDQRVRGRVERLRLLAAAALRARPDRRRAPAGCGRAAEPVGLAVRGGEAGRARADARQPRAQA